MGLSNKKKNSDPDKGDDCRAEEDIRGLNGKTKKYNKKFFKELFIHERSQNLHKLQ